MAKLIGRKTKTETPGKEWTVMVYMAADKDAELDAVAVADLKEMETGVAQNPDVNVVVQVNRFWPNAAQGYHIHQGGTKLVPLSTSEPTGMADERTDMADGKTLIAFLTSVLQNRAFQANHYALVLWGHAYGLGF